MSTVEGNGEPIYVFEVEETYLFKHYFERTDVFAELRAYYSDADYRFEVPADEFSDVEAYLERNHYNPVIVDEPEEFSVVKEEYTAHAEILRNSVMHWTRRGYNFFVMQDPMAVERAIESGATRVEDTDLVLGI